MYVSNHLVVSYVYAHFQRVVLEWAFNLHGRDTDNQQRTRARCFKQIWKVGKVGKAGKEGKVRKVGR